MFLPGSVSLETWVDCVKRLWNLQNCPKGSESHDPRAFDPVLAVFPAKSEEFSTDVFMSEARTLLRHIQSSFSMLQQFRRLFGTGGMPPVSRCRAPVPTTAVCGSRHVGNSLKRYRLHLPGHIFRGKPVTLMIAVLVPGERDFDRERKITGPDILT